MKKFLKLTILVVVALVLAGCGKQEYTIKFETGMEKGIENMVVKEGQTIKLPEAPDNEGYVFDGWYVGDEKFDETTEITENITLTARWKFETEGEIPEGAITFKVKFDYITKGKVVTVEVEENKKVKEPKKPTRSGYTFGGWYLGKKKYNFNTKVTKDITLTANWEKVEATKETPKDTRKITMVLEDYSGGSWAITPYKDKGGVDTIGLKLDMDGIEYEKINWKVENVDKTPYAGLKQSCLNRTTCYIVARKFDTTQYKTATVIATVTRKDGKVDVIKETLEIEGELRMTKPNNTTDFNIGIGDTIEIQAYGGWVRNLSWQMPGAAIGSIKTEKVSNHRYKFTCLEGATVNQGFKYSVTSRARQTEDFIVTCVSNF